MSAEKLTATTASGRSLKGPNEKIVLLGIMSRKPVAGVVWQVLHYLLGFKRLGYDVYYVEAHGYATGLLMREGEEGSATAAAFIDGVMRRFDLGDRWAYHAVHTGGRCYGLSEAELKRLYGSAALIINLHGATHPLPEHYATGRLVYLETDPVLPQIELHQGVKYTFDFLASHCAFFTFGENYGAPDCKLPVSEGFDFLPTRQPVVADLWEPFAEGAGRLFTTIGSWRQPEREVTFEGEVYHWSKHLEFIRFLDLPARSSQSFELALNRYDGADQRLLESKGWSVRDALEFSMDPDAYRRYIADSRGEFTVAKDQNVRLRSGWFSDRSATYLAAGRPVVTQETGFSNVLPTGEGLFAFSEMEEAAQAIESINSDYDRHRKAASTVVREYFDYGVVLTQLLEGLGLSGSTDVRHRSRPRCSIIIPVHNGAALTRRCLDALLSGSTRESFEVIVVDDASTDATRQLLAGYDGRVQALKRETNGGFAAACNDGAGAASGEYLVFLNNDVVPKSGWLDALVRHADNHPKAAAVGGKLLFPDGTVQHAGVVVCQDLYPRHIYAGFPADHPAVNKSRRFQVVTAASVLLRREPFEEAGGFDPTFRNGFEDVDLCLRLGERGHEVHYCHESVGEHLEAVSEGRLDNEEANFRLYRERWGCHLLPDDLRYYAEDGLLTLSYARSLPARLSVSPLLAVGDGGERASDRLLNLRSRQVSELLKETIRLTVLLADAEPAPGERPAFGQGFTGEWDALVNEQSGEEGLRAMLMEAHEQLRLRDEELESLAHDLQGNLLAGQGFAPGKHLTYQRLVRRVREVASEALPPGADVIVVSKGDDALLELGESRRGRHFPQAGNGVYAGHYPADGAGAIAQLEELRSRGGEFLLIPETAYWWLDHYQDFGEHLEERYRLKASQEEACLIFDLREPGDARRNGRA